MALEKITKIDLEKIYQNAIFPKNEKNVFLVDVCKNMQNLDIFDKINNADVLFYKGIIGGKQKISIDRKFIQKIANKDDNFKSYPTKAGIEKSIEKITGNDNISKYQNIVLELESGDAVGRKTTLRQDFTCFVIDYFFNNESNPYEFFNKFLEGELAVNKKKISISSNFNDFFAYLYPNNFEDLLDSIATALTIKKNSSKLKLKNLTNYIIAEESSMYGNNFKKEPFEIIRKNESNYYSASDKMTTADIFLYNKANKPSNMEDYYSVIANKDLTHNTFSKYITKSMVNGYIVPISLKKLTLNDVGNDLTSSKVKIINIAEQRSDGYEDEITDPFLLKVVELLSIQNKSKFIEEMEKVIHIKNETIKLNMYGTRATFDFQAKFKKDTETYDVFVQNNQIYIKPPNSTSNAGLGGVTLNYIKEEILNELPRVEFFKKLKLERHKAFEKSFNVEVNILDKKIGALDTKDKLKSIIKKYKIVERKYKDPQGIQRLIEECVNRLNLSNKKQQEKNRDELRKNLKNKKINDIIDHMSTTQKKYGWSADEMIKIIKDAKIIKKYAETPLLKYAKILSPSEYAKIFASIPENQRDDIAVAYVMNLEEGIEGSINSDFAQNNRFIESRFEAVKDGTLRFLTPKEREELIYSKLSSLEFLYYIGCNDQYVKKWIKNALIMGIYGIASASGIIVMNGKNIKLGKFGKDAIKRRNSTYVKIGL
jgi:hypothetical protein